MAEFILTGIKELDKELNRLDRKVSNKVARSTLRKGGSIGAKAVRKEIPSLQKSARKAIGHSVKKGKAGITEAKIGTTGKRTSSSKRTKKHSGGVGITKNNIHWYLLGTAKRRHKSGKNTGAMPGNDAVSKGILKSRSAMKAGMIKQAEKTLAKEVSKSASR